jgi:hypothetical protein
MIRLKLSDGWARNRTGAFGRASSGPCARYHIAYVRHIIVQQTADPKPAPCPATASRVGQRTEERSKIHVRHKRPATPLLAPRTCHLARLATQWRRWTVLVVALRCPCACPLVGFGRVASACLVVGCQRVASFQISHVSILRACSCSLCLLDCLPGMYDANNAHANMTLYATAATTASRYPVA